MDMKLIVAMVNDELTKTIITAAREAGATGATIVGSARGEGLKPEKTFFGLDLVAQRDMVMFLVAAPIAREILEAIEKAGKMDENPGAGIAFQIKIEDAVGLKTQLPTLFEEVGEQI